MPAKTRKVKGNTRGTVEPGTAFCAKKTITREGVIDSREPRTRKCAREFLKRQDGVRLI